MKNKKIYITSLILSALSHSLSALPLDPQHQDIGHDFSLDLRKKFYLYADSESDSILWYAAKESTLAENTAVSNQPNLDLGVFRHNRESYVWLKGAFDIRGSKENLESLRQEAEDLGYALHLAPIKIIQGYVNMEGKHYEHITYQCDETIRHNKSTYPVCYTLDDQGRRNLSDTYIEMKTKAIDDKFFSFQMLAPGSVVPIYDQLVGYDRFMNQFLPEDDPFVGQSWNKLFIASVRVNLSLYKPRDDSNIAQHSRKVEHEIPLSIECVRGGYNTIMSWVSSPYCKKYTEKKVDTVQLNTSKSLFEQARAHENLNKTEALGRLHWAKRCGHISAKMLKHFSQRRVLGKYISLIAPFYPVYIDKETNRLWLAPTAPNNPCPSEKYQEFSIYGYSVSQKI